MALDELRPATKDPNPTGAKWPTAKERAEESSRNALDLIRLYPETREMIEQSRVETLKRLTTPR